MALELLNFMKENADWRNILIEEPYYLTISEEGNRVMFKYNQIKSDFSNPIVRDARGIIIDTSKMEVVCYPFSKFGNYGESYAAEIDWNTARVLEKIDGSLIKFWWDKEKKVWNYSTNGTIDAYKAPLNNSAFNTFGDLIFSILAINTVSMEHWNKNYTHMFELISPYNRVVVSYDKVELCYLGSRRNDTGIEREFNAIFSEFRQPKIYKLNSLEGCIQTAKELDGVDEGFVVVDANYNRVKVKNPAYVAAHRLFGGNVTNERLLELIISNETEEFENYFPEYSNQIENVKNDINKFKKKILVISSWTKNVVGQGMNRKDLAINLKTLCPDLSFVGFQTADGKTEEDIFNKISLEKLKVFLEYK